MLPSGATGSGESVTPRLMLICGVSYVVVALFALLPLFGSVVVPDGKKFALNEPSANEMSDDATCTVIVKTTVEPAANVGVLQVTFEPKGVQLKPAGATVF